MLLCAFKNGKYPRSNLICKKKINCVRLCFNTSILQLLPKGGHTGCYHIRKKHLVDSLCVTRIQLRVLKREDKNGTTEKGRGTNFRQLKI